MRTITARILILAMQQHKTFDKINAVYLVTDAPSGLEFGVDCITYETGPNFSGLSDLPPGFHFIYYSTGMGSRQGYFIKAIKEKVFVHTWDTKNEEILPFNRLSPESLASLFDALSRGDLNSNLAAYPLHQHHTWMNISNLIDDEVLQKSSCPVLKLIIPGDDSDLVSLENKLASNRKKRVPNDVGLALKPYFPNEGRVAQFVNVARIELDLLNAVHADGNRASDITNMMLDKTSLLEKIIKDEFSGVWQRLLGQFQLAFVLFMFLYSFPSLEYWKLMTSTICSCATFLRSNVEFTACFIKSFYAQLSFCPPDFFENELSKDNFLRPVISSLFLSLQGLGRASEPLVKSPNAEGDNSSDKVSESNQSFLMEHKKRLFNFLKKKFNLFEDSIYERANEDANGVTTANEDDADVADSRNQLDEELVYNLVEHDMPVFLSEVEVDRVLYGTDKLGGAKRRDGHSSAGNADAQAKIAKTMEASDEFRARWSAMDAALQKSAESFLQGEEDILTSVQLCSLQGAADEKEKEKDSGAGGQYVEAVSSLPTHPLSPQEKEQALFSWRYPLVFESMMARDGREDMTMAAMRILDETEAIDGEGSKSRDRSSMGNLLRDLELLRLEAIRFLEFEVAK